MNKRVLLLCFTALALSFIFLSLRPQDEGPSESSGDALAKILPGSVVSIASGQTSHESRKPDLVLPALDHAELFEEARLLEEKQGRYLFASSRQTKVAPHLGGQWSSYEDRAQWRYRLRSVGATSLNLGFSEFHLPPDATFTVSDPKGMSQAITFTSRDNEDHGQLWTPIFRTDELELLVDVPAKLAHDLRLRLDKTNHGFRSKVGKKTAKAIGDSNSGSCNIDVICSAMDDPNFGPLVDLYRDQIRSVAAYTLGGTETCTGALVNNVRNDLTPYFLTADHCEITPANAPSIVVYWNFENSSCRTPSSSNSGGNGDGPITQFNTGSVLRATRSNTDFCLIELDDPVDPTFNPYYAGWDRSGSIPSSTIGIHHPGVSEKRISFDLDPPTTTSYSGDSNNLEGTHWRVGDWNFGTTEGGSSGSPLFDEAGKIIGQLHGGSAACGNDLPDWYGRFSKSWADGGTAQTQLSTWLDPDGSGEVAIEGTNSDELFSISDASVTEGDAGTQEVEVIVSLSKATSETVSVTVSTAAATATGDDFVALTQRLEFAPNELSKILTIVINGDTSAEENESFELVLSEAENAIVSSQAGRITILNDDFIQPVIDSPTTAQAAASSPFEYRITAVNTPTMFSITDGPIGMLIDPMTGVLSWTPTAAGTETVTIEASNPSGSGTSTLTITVTPNTLVEALDLTSNVIVTNESPGWFLQNGTTFDGLDAAQSDSVGDGQSARFSIQITGPDLLEYQQKVSSERGFDFLTVSLDGDEKSSVSGDVDWEMRSLPIPTGLHTVTFSYEKDGSVAEGDDAAWIDKLALVSLTGRPALVSPASLNVETGADFSYEIVSLASDAVLTVSNLPAELQFDGVSTITGTFVDPGDVSFDLLASSSGQEDRLNVTLRVLTPVGDAVDFANLPWAYEGDAIWFGQEIETFDGVDAAQSGAVTDNESSSISITVTGPDQLNFQWKVSSEAKFDELAFLLDGVPLDGVDPISGELDWQSVSVDIPSGSHVLTWQYAKDSSESDGEDAGWVDDIRFGTGSRPVILGRFRSEAVIGFTTRLPVEFLNTEARDFVDLPPWLSYDVVQKALVGTPPVAGEFSFQATAGNGEEATSRRFILTVQAVSQALANTLGQSDLAITSSGDVAWSPDSFGGVVAARSGLISDGEESTMSFLVQGPGTLRFRWMVDSEEDFDFLSYSLNGAVQAEISGEVPWEQIEIPLEAGINEIAWRYEKDGSEEAGEDLGRVDRLILGGFARFLSEQPVDPYSVAPNEDPDLNGLSLLHEYAFPNVPGAASQFSPLTISDLSAVAGQFGLEFLGLSPLGGVDYSLEFSSDLSSAGWTVSEEAFEIESAGSNARYRLNSPSLPDGADKLFFRVRARLR